MKNPYLMGVPYVSKNKSQGYPQYLWIVKYNCHYRAEMT